MKRIVSVLALGAAILGIWSCSKSSSSNASPYAMTASKNGSNVSFSGQSSVIAMNMGTMMMIEGITVGGHDTTGFIFELMNYNGVGTYPLNDTASVGEYISGSSLTGALIATSGSVTITSVTSTLVKGTFNFTTSNGTNISNGSFSAYE